MWYTKDTQSESPGSWNDSLGPWSAKVSSHLNWIVDASKGHFTLQWLVEKTKDSNNLIGWKRKFVFWTFTLEANNQRTKPLKTPTWQHFLQVLAPRVWLVGKSLYNINGNPNSPQDDKLFIPNLCKLHNPHILMDFYLVLFVRVLFWLDGHSAKCP
jgi:hypothetical protein